MNFSTINGSLFGYRTFIYCTYLTFCSQKKTQSYHVQRSALHRWFSWNDRTCCSWGLSSEVPLTLWALIQSKHHRENISHCVEFLVIFFVVDGRACKSSLVKLQGNYKCCLFYNFTRLYFCTSKNMVNYFLNVVATLQWCIPNSTAHVMWAQLCDVSVVQIIHFDTGKSGCYVFTLCQYWAFKRRKNLFIFVRTVIDFC